MSILNKMNNSERPCREFKIRSTGKKETKQDKCRDIVTQFIKKHNLLPVKYSKKHQGI